MIANIHIFNVNHGDSSLIEIVDADKSYWIIVDSNTVVRKGITLVPCLEFLKKRGVSEIDTVILTHLHSDHYSGLDDIIDNFKINRLIVPPFFNLNKMPIFQKQLDNIKNKIAELTSRTSDPEIGRKAYCLAKIIKFIADNEDKVIYAEGPETIFRLTENSTSIGRIFLPMKKMKGTLYKVLESGDFELDTFKSMNDASVVFSLELQGQVFLFGADSTLTQWADHKKHLKKSNVKCLDATSMKIPHHGSKHNTDKTTYNYLLKNKSENLVFLSANGKSHPDDEFFTQVNDRNLLPYCTNLAKQCLGTTSNISSISSITKLPSVLRSFISAYDIEDLPINCQGDITIKISKTSTDVYSSTGMTCPYRLTKSAPVLSLI